MIFDGVVCTFCGCLCDDIQAKVEEDKITNLAHACVLGKGYIMAAQRQSEKPRLKGKDVSLDVALDAAAAILHRSLHPLIYGLSSTTCEAQAKAVELAELLGASIDSTASVCHSPSDLAKQLSGLSSCSLGEVKNRADLVIYWGCNPAETHLRHATRYALMPHGMFVPRGRQDRRVIVVDVRRTQTAKMADLFIPVQPGYDFECLQVMRALLHGEAPEQEIIGGVELETLKALLQEMKSCRYGVIFFGMGLTMSSGDYNNVVAAIELVRLLNAYTRFAIMPMRGHGNVAGAEQTLSRLTGFPFAVNFSRGYPRYGPGEFTAVDLLVREEVDAALVIASDPLAHLPFEAAKWLQQVPLVVLDVHENYTSRQADVFIPVAPCGVAAEGTAYRMDNIPLRLKKIIPSLYQADEELLASLKERIRCLK